MRLVDAAHHSEVVIQCTIALCGFLDLEGRLAVGGGLSAGQVHARVMWACLHVYIARHGALFQP